MNRSRRQHQPKSAADVREQFYEAGISVAEWARNHKVHPSTVRMVLSGRRPALRGDSHKVAVLLGLKVGRIDINPQDMVVDLSRRPR